MAMTAPAGPDVSRYDQYVTYVLIVAAIGSVGLFLGLAIRYAGQPLLEAQGFRQTHTALTAYWLMRDGFSFAYETPVAGYPWVIPWEFPLYQTIVAGVTTVFGGSLDANGRIVSALFLVACIAPVGLLIRRLRLSCEVWLTCIALIFSSPAYVFWGRAFLIETTALFFGLSFLALVLGASEPDAPVYNTVVAGAMGVLAGLQKATVGLPIVALAGLVWAWSVLRRGSGFPPRQLFKFFLAIVIPIGCAFAWNAYTDALKQHNALAAQLTTAAPKAWAWNFGTMAERLHPHPWKLVLWDRAMRANGGGVLGALLLGGVLVHPRDTRLRWYVAMALLFLFVPVAIFTNLYAVHDYYQMEILTFLLLALAIAVGVWLPLVTGTRWFLCLALSLLIGSNLFQFRRHYLSTMRGDFNRNILVLADVIKHRTPPNSSIVVYGLDWSSELPYYAERRAFCVPPWFEGREAVWSNPESFLGGAKPSAVVICRGEGIPSAGQIAALLQNDQQVSEIEVAGCQVLLRERRELD